jgi:hypothetical protein
MDQVTGGNEDGLEEESLAASPGPVMEGSAKEPPAAKTMGREGGRSSRLAAKETEDEQSEEEDVMTGEEVQASLSQLERETWGSGGVPQQQGWMVKINMSVLEDMKIELDAPYEVQGSLEEADSTDSPEDTELEAQMAKLKVQKDEMGRLRPEADGEGLELVGLLAGQEDSSLDMAGEEDTVGVLEERQLGLHIDTKEQAVESRGDEVEKMTQMQLLQVRSLVICVVNMFPAGTEHDKLFYGGPHQRD